MHKKSIFLLCIIGLALAGCGKKEQTVSTPQGDVTISQQGGTTTWEAKSDKGEQVKITANDKGVALPKNFPEDIPLMTGAVVKLALDAGDAISVHYAVPAAPGDVGKFYQDSLKAKGWKIEQTATMGELTMVSASKDKREAAITVQKNSGGSGSLVQMTIPQAKK